MLTATTHPARSQKWELQILLFSKAQSRKQLLAVVQHLRQTQLVTALAPITFRFSVNMVLLNELNIHPSHVAYTCLYNTIDGVHPWSLQWPGMVNMLLYALYSIILSAMDAMVKRCKKQHFAARLWDLQSCHDLWGELGHPSHASAQDLPGCTLLEGVQCRKKVRSNRFAQHWIHWQRAAIQTYSNLKCSVQVSFREKLAFLCIHVRSMESMESPLL